LFSAPDPSLPKRLYTKNYRGTGQSSLKIKNFKRIYLEMDDLDGGGVSITGHLVTLGGGIPNGSESIAFELSPGEIHDILPFPVFGAGIEAGIDLYSTSPDFVLIRLQASFEERTLYGA
jgi:hypothetical protein